uniref:Phosphoesterase n=1 Tax=Quercus lobata TaxID=97700 RepID=A0A7N2MRV3_QUELO
MVETELQRTGTCDSGSSKNLNGVGVGSLNGNRKMKKKVSAILYHYPCPDGAFAALAAHLYFSATSLPALFFPNTVYNPIKPQNLPLHEFEIGDLYLLDFVGPSGFVQQLSSIVDRVVILDHHKTALSETSLLTTDNVSKVIDMERSGATIAFDYFKDKLINDNNKHDDGHLGVYERVRPLFDYIEDGDLWRWRLLNSKAFSSGLKDLSIEYDVRLNPTLFQQLLGLDVESVITQGMLSLSHKQILIDDALNHSYQIALAAGRFGHCLAVDADSISELRSELGHQLATKSRNQNLRHSFLEIPTFSMQWKVTKGSLGGGRISFVSDPEKTTSCWNFVVDRIRLFLSGEKPLLLQEVTSANAGGFDPSAGGGRNRKNMLHYGFWDSMGYARLGEEFVVLLETFSWDT